MIIPGWIKRLLSTHSEPEPDAERRLLETECALLQGSNYFDGDFYLAQNPDVAGDGISPARHYLEYGAAEGRNPSGRFDTRFYLNSYSDVAASGMNPLLHYLLHGMGEGRLATRPIPGQHRTDSPMETALAAWRRKQARRIEPEILFPPASGLMATDHVHVFTAIAANYIPKARVLAWSVKRQHPDWSFTVVLADDVPEGFSLDDEPFDRILGLDELGIENWQGWAFRHRLVEICTATKGPAATVLLGEGAEKILYLDPDTVVFGSLAPLAAMLDEHPVILTPHLLSPEQNLDAIRDNEINILRHGVYNLGFFALAGHGQGPEFAKWWRRRLEHFCYVDYPNGLFTDQRWCDLAPALFDQLLILRDPGYNVATWNLAHRRLEFGGPKGIRVNGAPLRFYHFTGYDTPREAERLQRLGAPDAVVWALWDWYSKELQNNGQQTLGSVPWKFGSFSDGRPILNEMRELYRERPDLRFRYPNPFENRGNDGGFFGWWSGGRPDV